VGRRQNEPRPGGTCRCPRGWGGSGTRLSPGNKVKSGIGNGQRTPFPFYGTCWHFEMHFPLELEKKPQYSPWNREKTPNLNSEASGLPS